MSKQPPVPAHNQSTYPIVEPPHESEALAAVKEMAAARKRRTEGRKQIGIGAAVGIGSAAIVAGLLYWRGNRRDPK